MVVDEEEFEIEVMFFGDSEGAFDQFGQILGFILGRADDGEIHGLDYNLENTFVDQNKIEVVLQLLKI